MGGGGGPPTLNFVHLNLSNEFVARKSVSPLPPMLRAWKKIHECPARIDNLSSSLPAYNKHSKNTNIVHTVFAKKDNSKRQCKWCMVASVLHFKTTDATSLKKSTYQFFEFFTSFIRFPFYLLFFHFFLRPFNLKEQIC